MSKFTNLGTEEQRIMDQLKVWLDLRNNQSTREAALLNTLREEGSFDFGLLSDIIELMPTLRAELLDALDKLEKQHQRNYIVRAVREVLACCADTEDEQSWLKAFGLDLGAGDAFISKLHRIFISRRFVLTEAGIPEWFCQEVWSQMRASVRSERAEIKRYVRERKYAGLSCEEHDPDHSATCTQSLMVTLRSYWSKIKPSQSPNLDDLISLLEEVLPENVTYWVPKYESPEEPLTALEDPIIIQPFLIAERLQRSENIHTVLRRYLLYPDLCIFLANKDCFQSHYYWALGFADNFVPEDKALIARLHELGKLLGY